MTSQTITAVILLWLVVGFSIGAFITLETQVRGKTWSQINYQKFFETWALGILGGPISLIYFFLNYEKILWERK